MFAKKHLAQERANLALFLSGKAISLFGSAIYTFAMGLYLLRTTGSGVSFALNIVLYTLPLVVINPIAGVVADRLPKKVIVVGADLLNGIFLLGVYVVAGRIGLGLPLVYGSTFVITVLATFFNIGIQAAKPGLVSGEKLVRINAVDQLVEASSYVLGPMLGGVVYALIDIRLFVLINALSFLLSALLECWIDYQYNPDADVAPSRSANLWLEMKEGYQYIAARQSLQAIVWIFGALNFFTGFAMTVPLPYLLNTVWQVDASIFGLIQGGFPVGMIVGALLVKQVLERMGYRKLLQRMTMLAGVGAFALGIPAVLSQGAPGQAFVAVYYTGLMFFSGIITSWVDVPKNVLLQQLVPSLILGRVLSIMMSIGKIILPVSLILSGALLNVTTPLVLFWSGATVFLGFNLWFFSSARGKVFTGGGEEITGV